MNKIKILSFMISIIIIVFMFCGCGTQYLGGNRIERWEKDLNYLQEALPNKHVNAFFKIREDDFNNKIEELKSDLNNLRDEEVENRIYEIVASIGDAHTKAYKQYDYRFPLNFWYFGDDLYLINTTEEYKQALYCKVESIDGQDIREIEEKLKVLTVQSNESNIKKTLPSLLSRPDVLKGAGIINNEESVIFTFKNSNDNDFTLEIKAIPNSDIKDIMIMDNPEDESNPLYRQHSDLNYWYKFLEDSKILYFKYNKCLPSEKSGDIEQVINEVCNYIGSGNVNKVVIDMRNNSGGSDGYLSPLIDKILNSDLNVSNKFYVIVGRETFSSAIIESCNIRQNTNATFIGESTSGTPRHYGATKNFTLPNSKMRIVHSTKFIDMSDDYSDSFVPNKTIELSIEDYKNKVDPIMEYIKTK